MPFCISNIGNKQRSRQLFFIDQATRNDLSMAIQTINNTGRVKPYKEIISNGRTESYWN